MSVCPDNGIGWEIEWFGAASMLLGLIPLVYTIVLSGSRGAPINVSEGRRAAEASPTLS